MKYLRFLVYSNLWISLGAAFLTYSLFVVNKLNANYNYILFVFFSTLVSYSIQRLFRIQTLQKTNSKSWVVANHKFTIGLVALSIVLATYFLYYFFSFYVFLFLLPTGIISLLYSYKKLRDVPFIKIILIGISWGITAGILPFIVSNKFDIYSIVINFIWVFLYIIAITIPFDIRDLNIDESNKKTIPQLVGEKNAKIIAVFIQLVSLGFFYLYFGPSYSIFYFVSSLIAILLQIFSSRKRSDLFYSFWVDGHLIIQFLLLYFLT